MVEDIVKEPYHCCVGLTGYVVPSPEGEPVLCSGDLEDEDSLYSICVACVNYAGNVEGKNVERLMD
jgi:hypothetical protein